MKNNNWLCSRLHVQDFGTGENFSFDQFHNIAWCKHSRGERILDSFANPWLRLGLACSRRSDSGERWEVKKSVKKKSKGGGEVSPSPLSPVPLYFLSLSLLRTALHYLNAWNRLATSCLHNWLESSKPLLFLYHAMQTWKRFSIA